MLGAVEGWDGTAGAAVASALGGPPAPAVAEGAGAEGASDAPFSVSMRATTVWTSTVTPSKTRISASTPAVGAGISASTLSVLISKIGSSRFTSSPTFFSHFDSVPSAIDSPIWGMMTSTRATAMSSHSELRDALRTFRIRHITIVGTRTNPIRAPHVQYVLQSHGAPVSPSDEHFVTAPTIFAISTAIMPPPARPAMALMHPTPT